MTWRLHGERLTVLGWPRAVLLQLAHPRIAAGVADHSSFGRSWLAPYARLMATVCAMRTLTFGSDHAARSVAARINTIHDRVHGALDEPHGAGTRAANYSAHDPALLAWVHVTLVDSTLVAYTRLVGPLSEADRTRYCDESAIVAAWFGVPEARLPRSATALVAAMSDMLESGELRVTAQAEAIARRGLHPPLGWLGGPFAGFARRLAIGDLPPQVRALYGFTWRPRDARALERGAALVRRLRHRAPDALTRWPESRALAPAL